MEQNTAKNALIGLSTADTLANVSSVIALLGEMEFYNDVDESCKYGLFIVHTLIRNSLEYEIERMRAEET